MHTFLLNHMVGVSNQPRPPEDGPGWPKFWFLVLTSTLLVALISFEAYGARIPGTDAASKLEAAGTLLKLVDTALFIWGARIFAGIAILSAGWNLKEQRFGVAIICIVSALVFGTAPIWVKNIFDIGGGNGIFS